MSEYLPDDAERLAIDAGELDYQPSAPRYDAAPASAESGIERRTDSAKELQRGLGFDGEVLKETIIRKLHEAGEPGFAIPLEGCHTRQTVKRCNGCRKVSIYYNRCEVRYCPCCASRLANDRRKSVEWWCSQITQPKHVVLTSRNTEDFTPERLRKFKEAWGKLRRRKFAANWRGGYYSIEVTNEGKGWHLHLHALVDARFIDQTLLALEWAKLIGQDIAIVKVKDVRKGDYLRELVKYVVKGQQMATWPAFEVASFVRAIEGQRTFGVFGTLYDLRKEHRAFLDDAQRDNHVCACGCTEFTVFTEAEWEWFECTNGKPDPTLELESRGATPQKPAPDSQLALV